MVCLPISLAIYCQLSGDLVWKQAGDDEVVLTVCSRQEYQIWSCSWYSMNSTHSATCFISRLHSLWKIWNKSLFNSLHRPRVEFPRFSIYIISNKLSETSPEWPLWMNYLHAWTNTVSISALCDVVRVLPAKTSFSPSLPTKSSSMLSNDQNSFPIFGCVLCRTNLSLLPDSLLPFSLPLNSEGPCWDPEAVSTLHCPQKELLRASGSLLLPSPFQAMWYFTINSKWYFFAVVRFPMSRFSLKCQPSILDAIGTP